MLVRREGAHHNNRSFPRRDLRWCTALTPVSYRELLELVKVERIQPKWNTPKANWGMSCLRALPSS